MLLLELPNFEIDGFHFNAFTNPGWVLAIIWIIYSYCVMFMFENPVIADKDIVESDPPSSKILKYLTNFS